MELICQKKIKYIDMNIINANARSLNKKLGSLIESFDEYDLSVALLTETWFSSGRDLERERLDLEYGENVALITKNRPGRGGGVAVAYDTAKMVMKEFKFPGNKYELVCAVGNSTAGNRKVAAIAVYIPPNQKKNETKKLPDCISDGISKLKSTYDNLMIVIGGDTNNRRLQHILADFPDMQLLDNPPTRSSAVLDETATFHPSNG